MKFPLGAVGFLFLALSCTPEYGFFATPAQLTATSSLAQGWQHRPFWERAKVETLSATQLETSVKELLTRPGLQWKIIVLAFEPTPLQMTTWKTLAPYTRWYWIDPTGSPTTVAGIYRLSWSLPQGWSLLGKASSKWAVQHHLTSALALVGESSSEKERQALLTSWSVLSPRATLTFKTILPQETAPEAVLSQIPAQTPALFLLYGPESADLITHLPTTTARFGLFVPLESYPDWDVVVTPDGRATYQFLLRSQNSPPQDLVNLPWKSVKLHS